MIVEGSSYAKTESVTPAVAQPAYTQNDHIRIHIPEMPNLLQPATTQTRPHQTPRMHPIRSPHLPQITRHTIQTHHMIYTISYKHCTRCHGTGQAIKGSRTTRDGAEPILTSCWTCKDTSGYVLIVDKATKIVFK